MSIAVILPVLLLITMFILYFLWRKDAKRKTFQIRKANDHARQTEERFRLIVESTTDVIWLSDFNLKLNYISPSVEKLLGYRVDEYLKKMTVDRIPPDYLKKLKEVVNEELGKENQPDYESNRSRIIELELYHANGSVVWVELSCSFIRDKHGQPTGLHGDMRDITETVHARSYIKKRLEMEQLLTDVTNKSFGTAGFENAIREILSNAVSILDISRAYIARYNSRNNTIINVFECCAAGIKNRTDYQQQQSCEFSWMCDVLKQGKVVNFSTVESIPDDYTKNLFRINNVFSLLIIPLILNDTFYGYIGFDVCKRPVEWQSEDIKVLQSLAYIIACLMERSATEKELIVKERSVELSMEAMAIAELDGRLTYVNQTFLTYWRCRHRNDVLNKSIFDFLKSDDYTLNVLAEIRQAGSWSGELKGIRLDGTEFDLRVQASLVTYTDDRPLCIHTSFIDITRQKLHEQELLRAKDKAEESNRLKSAFLANMSHEIRTPMNSILGFLNLLQEVDFSVQEKENFITIIKDSGKRLLDTLNDICESAVIQAGETVVNSEEFDLSELMNSIFYFYKPEADKNNITLQISYNLPSFVFTTDKYKLERILKGLLQNALKFTSQGFVEFGAVLKGNFIEFFVVDTGKGIAEGQADKIFSAFMQEEMCLNRRYEGIGLGLSISKAYVEKLGGRIWYAGNNHGGTTFYFTIPYTPAKPADLLPAYNDMKSGNILQGRKILIAEDDQFSYMLLEIALSGLGAEIIHTESGEVTIEALQQNPEISLILMDIKMNGMNGIETVRKIREMKFNLPIITQTAFAFADDQRLAFEAGCNDYITKPINRELLIQKIHKLLLQEQP